MKTAYVHSSYQEMKSSNLHKGYPGTIPGVWVDPYYDIACALKEGKKVQWKKLSRVDKWYDYQGIEVNKAFSPERYRIVS